MEIVTIRSSAGMSRGYLAWVGHPRCDALLDTTTEPIRVGLLEELAEHCQHIEKRLLLSYA